jgi:alpha-L-rhamnosidase/F5/8 type C domain
MRRREFLKGGSLSLLGIAAAGRRPAAAGAGAAAPAPLPAELRWPAAASEARPWVYWWWLGSAVDEAGVAGALERYAEAGIGGVHIVPIYGAQGFESRYIDHLSPRWIDVLGATVRAAGRLGMGVDMTTGTGWPFGGPEVAKDDSAALLLLERWTVAGGNRLQAPVRSAAQPDATVAMVAAAAADEVVDLTARVGPDGALDWTAPAGRDWTVHAAFTGRTGLRVERAAPGGEGLVIDYLSPRALGSYLARFDGAFGGGGPGVRAMYHDSWEVHGANWTGTFPADFRALRGYDLAPHLPALAGGDAQERRRLVCDVRETFGDLLVERFAATWVGWSNEHGAQARNQAHGSPGNWLDLYAIADIPETEGFGRSGFPIPGLRNDPDYPDAAFGRPDPLVMKFASSAAHLAGRQLCSSETATWLGEHFRVALSQVKPEVDQLFAAGINHVFLHGTAYTPPDVPWPGWQYYASTHFNPDEALWHDMPAFGEYAARCQSILQHGSPDEDVLLYFPLHDLWQSDVFGDLVPEISVHSADRWLHGHPTGFGDTADVLRRRGFCFDYVSDRLLERLRTSGGRLYGGRSEYATIVVPGCRLMPVATLERLRDLAAAGATILVERALPEDVPGLGDLEARRGRLAAVVAEITGSARSTPSGSEHPVGRGRVVVTQGVEGALAAVGARREPAADHGLQLIRRRHDEGHHLFVVNLGAELVDRWIGLGVEARSVALLDPRSGDAGPAPVRQRRGRTEVRLRLLPGESRVLRTFARRELPGSAPPVLAPLGDGVELRGEWRVEFLAGGPALPAPLRTRELRSWTELSGDDARAFSGTARYTLEFDAPADDAQDWVLDLGTVAESARVRLNGVELAGAWSIPFQVRAGDALRRGRNVLEVDVTNLSANRIAELSRRGVPWQRYFFVNINYGPFDASGWEPAPSGLLGPVRLVPQVPCEQADSCPSDFELSVAASEPVCGGASRTIAATVTNYTARRLRSSVAAASAGPVRVAPARAPIDVPAYGTATVRFEATVDEGTPAGTHDVELRFRDQRVTAPVTVAPAPRGPNFALEGEVSASSSHPLFPPQGAADGNRNSEDWGRGTGWNDNTRGAFPDWLQVTFPCPVPVGRVDLYTLDSVSFPAASNGLRDYDVQLLAGGEWATVAQVRGNVAGHVRSTFATTAAAAVRILGLADNAGEFSRIVELEVYES